MPHRHRLEPVWLSVGLSGLWFRRRCSCGMSAIDLLRHMIRVRDFHVFDYMVEGS